MMPAPTREAARLLLFSALRACAAEGRESGRSFEGWWQILAARLNTREIVAVTLRCLLGWPLKRVGEWLGYEAIAGKHAGECVRGALEKLGQERERVRELLCA